MHSSCAAGTSAVIYPFESPMGKSCFYICNKIIRAVGTLSRLYAYGAYRSVGDKGDWNVTEHGLRLSENGKHPWRGAGGGSRWRHGE